MDPNDVLATVSGGYALKKLLGPVFDVVGQDITKAYEVGRNRIFAKATQKIEDIDDGKSANLRVTHDVVASCTFTDDELCAEYFGGVLAASRSDDGKDDSAMQLLHTIKSLSSKQLQLHYAVYNALNKLLVLNQQQLNLASSQDVHGITVWFISNEFEHMGINIDTDLHILSRQGLLFGYQYDNHTVDENRRLHYTAVTPTTYGFLLYAVAYNRLKDYRSLASTVLPDFPAIQLPRRYALTLEGLLSQCEM